MELLFEVNPMEPDALVDLLLGESPREAALRTLEWIRAHSQARSVSLWRVVAGSPSLELGAAVDQETIAGLEKALAKGQERLEAGQPYKTERELLVSIEAEHGAHHVLYVDGVAGERRDLEAVHTYARVALRALRHPGTSGPRLSEDAKRNELVSLLTVHEWNIARVARARNVTRKTIYEWLKKFNISRERVQKA
jgi:hypothetical protein